MNQNEENNSTNTLSDSESEIQSENENTQPQQQAIEATESSIETSAAIKKPRRGRPKGATRLQQLKKILAYEALLEFWDEMALRDEAMQKARKAGDYKAMHQMLEDVVNRVRGKPPVALHHTGLGGGIVAVKIIAGGDADGKEMVNDNGFVNDNHADGNRALA